MDNLRGIMQEELIQAAMAGDKRAYASLVGQHARAVLGTCMGILRNVHDADDVAQETFVKGFVQLPTLRSHDQFLPWIIRIARNQCVDFVRHRDRERRVVMESLANASKMPDPERNESRDRLRHAIDGLPEKYRLPLVLYYFDGQRTESVAKALNLDPATVATRLSRARKQLRAKLQPQEGKE